MVCPSTGRTLPTKLFKRMVAEERKTNSENVNLRVIEKLEKYFGKFTSSERMHMITAVSQKDAMLLNPHMGGTASR